MSLILGTRMGSRKQTLGMSFWNWITQSSDDTEVLLFVVSEGMTTSDLLRHDFVDTSTFWELGRDASVKAFIGLYNS